MPRLMLTHFVDVQPVRSPQQQPVHRRAVLSTVVHRFARGRTILAGVQRLRPCECSVDTFGS
jgi:hypothetical protein